MKNQNNNGTAPVTPQEKETAEVESVNPLQEIVSQLGQVIKLQWSMARTLKSIEDSIAIFAAQKKRELDSEQPKTESQ
jgi:hypothetical protein